MKLSFNERMEIVSRTKELQRKHGTDVKGREYVVETLMKEYDLSPHQAVYINAYAKKEKKAQSFPPNPRTKEL